MATYEKAVQTAFTEVADALAVRASLAERLAAMLAQRIEALPSAHQAMHKAADLLTVGAAMEHLQPWVGNGRAVQFVVRSVLNRLPLSEVMDEWGRTRAEWGEQASRGDPALRAFVAEHYQPEPKRRKRPDSFRTLQDRFGNPASVSTEKLRGGGGGGGHG